MNRLLEFAVNHYFLVSAAVVLAVVGIIMELRLRGRGSLAVSPADAVHIMNRGGALVLDVRDSKDYEAGHIIDARSIPAKELQGKLDTFKKYKEKPVLVYCDNGAVSASAAQELRAQGFGKVVTLRGGLQSWRQDNLPVMKSTPVKRKDGKAA
jgi:rhodanese-related sulfurtransferase